MLAAPGSPPRPRTSERSSARFRTPCPSGASPCAPSTDSGAEPWTADQMPYLALPKLDDDLVPPKAQRYACLRSRQAHDDAGLALQPEVAGPRGFEADRAGTLDIGSGEPDTESSMLRNTATQPCGVLTTRAPRRGICSRPPMSIQLCSVMVIPPRGEMGDRRSARIRARPCRRRARSTDRPAQGAATRRTGHEAPGACPCRRRPGP